MSKLLTAFRLMKTPRKMIKPLGDMNFFNWLDDKHYLKLLYFAETGRRLNLKNPSSFNEKLQWMKLYNRKSDYSIYVDKYKVRKYISEIIGEEYLIPMIGVYNSVDEIPWAELPSQFVLKCTHGSGCNVICKDKAELDISEVKRKLNNWMNKSWYWFGREWPYKNIRPCIICEKYMVDESSTELKDYKFMCFNGEPKIIQVMSGRSGGDYYLNHFDVDWNKVDIKRKNLKERPGIINKPDSLNEMIEISKKLSRNMPFSRIDLYNTNKGILFGEITFFPVSGFMNFEDEAVDELLGSWITLPEK